MTMKTTPSPHSADLEKLEAALEAHIRGPEAIEAYFQKYNCGPGNVIWNAAEAYLDLAQRGMIGQGWQDIATAPLDGSRVMLWSKECNAPHSGQFYSTGWGYECARFKYQPTHWQPLPLPPAAVRNAMEEG